MLISTLLLLVEAINIYLDSYACRLSWT